MGSAPLPRSYDAPAGNTFSSVGLPLPVSSGLIPLRAIAIDAHSLIEFEVFAEDVAHMQCMDD